MKMETKGKNSKHHIHFGSGGENSHSHTPAATPASAIGRFPPLKAYSSQSASYLRPVAVTPPSSASLCIWIQKTDVFFLKQYKGKLGLPRKKSVNRTVFFPLTKCIFPYNTSCSGTKLWSASARCGRESGILGSAAAYESSSASGIRGRASRGPQPVLECNERIFQGPFHVSIPCFELPPSSRPKAKKLQEHNKRVSFPPKQGRSTRSRKVLNP